MKRKIFYSSLAALILFPAVSMAEETEEAAVKTMGEVVVTATRTEKDVKKVPANVTVITAEKIADSGATSVVEVLNKQANIHVRTFSGNPAQAQVDLRGFGENGFGRTLILLDGRRLNKLDMASINWTQIPLEQIERIEVVRGSGSVLYGDAAVAGVIHIMTKKGAQEPVFTGGVKLGEDSFYDLSAGVSGSSDRLSYSINGSNQKTDGWRDRTGFHAYGGGFQLGYDLSDNLSVSGGVSFNNTDYELPKSLTKDELAQDRTQAGYPDHEAENEFQNANVLLEGSFGKIGDFEINVVHGTSDLTADRPTDWSSFIDQEQKTFGIQPKYILSSGGNSIMNELVIGVDIYRESLDVNSYLDVSRTNKKIRADFDKDTVGWYIHDEISIGENLIISGGGRIEETTFQGMLVDYENPIYDYNNEKKHDGDAYEIGAIWLPTETMKAYIKYSTVYRYPFTDEHASYFGSSQYGGDYFNPNLEAEEGKSTEAGLAMTLAQDLSYGVTLFHIDMENEISWNGSINENLDDTRHRGFEAFLEYVRQGMFDFLLNYTFQEGTFEAGSNKGKDIPLVPNHLLNATLDLTLPFDMHLVPSLKYVGESYLSGDNDNNTEKLESHTVVDVLLRYKNRVGRLELTVFFGVNNLFDEKYSTFGIDLDQYDFPPYYDADNVFYPAPGRKFYGGISGRF